MNEIDQVKTVFGNLFPIIKAVNNKIIKTEKLQNIKCRRNEIVTVDSMYSKFEIFKRNLKIITCECFQKYVR